MMRSFGRRLDLLEVARVRHRRGRAGHALDGRVEIVEGLLGDDGGDLGAHAGEARARLHHHRPVRLAHGAQDRLRSIGRSVRGSTISTEMPSLASSSAASSARYIMPM